MKFTVSKSSDWNYKETVEINTLEEMKEFQLKHCYSNENWNNCSLIVDFNNQTIEIYDTYRE